MYTATAPKTCPACNLCIDTAVHLLLREVFQATESLGTVSQCLAVSPVVSKIMPGLACPIPACWQLNNTQSRLRPVATLPLTWIAGSAKASLVGAKMVHVASAGMVSSAACRVVKGTQQQQHRAPVSTVVAFSGVAVALPVCEVQAQLQLGPWHLQSADTSDKAANWSGCK